jgi:ankyrin repeat protein
MKKIKFIFYWVLAFKILFLNITLANELDISEESSWEIITIPDIENCLANNKDILNVELKDGMTFFTYAILYCKNLDIIRYLIKHGGDANYKSKYRDITILHLAIDASQPPVIIQELINAGANINEINSYGITPLMFAMKESNIPAVELLVNNGADLNTLDADGTGLNGYAWGDTANSAIYQQRIKPFAKRSLPSTSHFWHTATVDDVIELAKSNYDFNKSFRFDRTPFMEAAEATTNPEVIRELIKHGANINYISEYGDKNALFFTINRFTNNDKLPVIEALISAGSHLNLIDEHGSTILSSALHRGTPELIEILVANNAELPKKFNKEDLLTSIESNKNGLKDSAVYKKSILPMIEVNK